jgi:hypothetical protein
VVSQLIRRGLKPAPPVKKGRRRFPVFDVPPNAPIITPERIDRFIEEEGLV